MQLRCIYRSLSPYRSCTPFVSYSLCSVRYTQGHSRPAGSFASYGPKEKTPRGVFSFCGPYRTRTCHPLIANEVLYQMS